MEFALASKGPVVIRYPKEFVPEDTLIKAATKEPFQLGKSVKISGSGNSKLAIISYGSILTEAIKAADLLNKENINVDVINARFAAPLDEKFVWYLQQGKAIITIEDHSIACGFGSAVLEMAVARNCRVNNIRLFGVPAKFFTHDSRYKQICSAGFNAENIAKAAREMLNVQLNNERVRHRTNLTNKI
jgi:1-deoxy-D-xylulose-5-phosphate synthase